MRKSLPIALVAGLLGTALVIYGIVSDKLIVSAAVVLIPLAVVAFVKSFDYAFMSVLLVLLGSFAIPTMAHAVDTVPFGLLVDGLILFSFVSVLAQVARRKLDFGRVNWDVVAVMGVWFLYCLLELLNPRMLSVKAWFTGMRSYAIYIVCLFVLTQVAAQRFRDFKLFLELWSVLVIIASVKVLVQRYVGFTPIDRHFLYVQEGYMTHIIYYGIRYFSIFSDAANYGGATGMAVAMFLIMGFHERRARRAYWWTVAGLALVGLFLSGTRSALVVPVAAILLYLALIRDWKKMIPISLALGAVVVLLAFTDIGGSVTSIRRARTIFDRKEDLSYQLRKENQARLRVLMKPLPFGNSLSMSGKHGRRYGDSSEISTIGTDSSLVKVWVESGIMGLLLYLAMMGYIFVKAAGIVFYKLKDPEVRGLTTGLLASIAGLFVMSTNNEVFMSIPNGMLVYIALGLIFLSPAYDREVLERKEKKKQNAGDIADNHQL